MMKRLSRWCVVAAVFGLVVVSLPEPAHAQSPEGRSYEVWTAMDFGNWFQDCLSFGELSDGIGLFDAAGVGPGVWWMSGEFFIAFASDGGAFWVLWWGRTFGPDNMFIVGAGVTVEGTSLQFLGPEGCLETVPVDGGASYKAPVAPDGQAISPTGGRESATVLRRQEASSRDETRQFAKTENRYGFLRRGADAKSLFYEALPPQDWWGWECVGSDELLFEEGLSWASALGQVMARGCP